MLQIGINMHRRAVADIKSVLRKQFDFFKEAGFNCVELSPGSVNLIRNGALDRRKSSLLLDILSAYDFCYTVHAPMKTNLASPSMAGVSEKIVRSCIDFSNLIDAKILVLHSGYITVNDRISEADALKVLANSVRKCASYASDLGVSIGIENGELGPTHLCRRIDKLIEAVKAINVDNVGITFDFGHAYIMSNYYGFDFMKSIREALPYIIHVHISDNFGKIDPLSPDRKDLVFGYGDLHLPIGWGSVPYKKILRLIKPVYKGIYVLEIDPSYKEQYRLAIENLKKLLAEASSLPKVSAPPSLLR